MGTGILKILEACGFVCQAFLAIFLEYYNFFLVAIFPHICVLSIQVVSFETILMVSSAKHQQNRIFSRKPNKIIGNLVSVVCFRAASVGVSQCGRCHVVGS